ncbi:MULTISPECIES: GNAT family N-acetyltransferase [unclassified Gilliamella]|uniref:GNAT family N-acetyltransferase n=1 Tax=unclassified Gilliamella TaxID=2685620 RepID=UPI001308784F|nr:MULTISPECIES: GNAT family N-acetyltransferase [unclassified Gilliamella]MWP48677.1 GNAT family N-acetyltransferase [Gilliamella sp. Lep-s35]MWP69872.1 GNAT family N-acetyltransferase [Gilliamella sp. Lep-s5]MWP76948.1 GNAT family N-acetyltransferase [Gilliamella sp. Lep-s21]
MHTPNNTRQLWVLQGETSQLFEQLIPIFEQNAGDWVTVTHQPDCLPCSLIANALKPNQTKQLLGQQYRHAVFDATVGFNLDAFAMLVGTLIKGSVLVLLLPNNLATWHDQDSLRWNECQTAITVPNFVAHLTQTLAEFGIIINQNSLPKTAVSPMFFEQVTDDNYDLTQQQTTLKQLLNSNKQINVVVAKRGRGKSALAGLFSHYQRCIVTAPNKSALTTFFAFAKPDTPFFAPDELIAQSHHNFANYLIIDEAAMIPLSMLEKLLQLAIANNSRVLLTTTVEGYEGTGQGFLLKLLANKACQYFYLHTPIRWQLGDKLEQFSDRLLLNGLLAQDNARQTSSLSAQYTKVDHNDVNALTSIFYLLKIAHYQTTLIDLRRLFDAQNLSVWQATVDNKKVAAAVTITEGNLPDDLIEQVWQGTRRPKGNLVAQSLVAHAGERLAAKLRSVRINRIAVISTYRRQSIAKQLVQNIVDDGKAHNCDFVSVSFAYSPSNYQFWTACGFTLVHISSHKQASSGSYSVMVLKSLTESGQQLIRKLTQRLHRNAYWLKNIIDLPFNQMIKNNSETLLSLNLDTHDFDELTGFAYYHRPFEASYPALCRLNRHIQTRLQSQSTQASTLPVLSALLKSKNNQNLIIDLYQLAGKQALMQTIKHEVRTWLAKQGNNVIFSQIDSKNN